MSTTDPRHYDVIISPVITEKATFASEQNQVMFKVARTATKLQKLGLAGVEVAGVGGTSWAHVEAHRAAPTSVHARSTPVFPETVPLANVVHYEFPARGELPPVKLHWYDGGMLPPRPEELAATL